MNSDHPDNSAPGVPPYGPVTADEARVLAVLLGEASPFEREAVDELLALRPDLRDYRDRTTELIGLLPAATKLEADESPLRLDDARRAALLEKLRAEAAENHVSESPIRFPSVGSDRKSRLIGFFRVAVISSRRYAAVLAVLLLLAGGIGVMVPLSSTLSLRRTAVLDNRDFRVDSFATGSGGGQNGEKADFFERKRKGLEDADASDGKFAPDVPATPVAPASTPVAAIESTTESAQFKSHGAPAIQGALPGPESPPEIQVIGGADRSRRLTLSGANTYTGDTTVAGGSLTLDGFQAHARDDEGRVGGNEIPAGKRTLNLGRIVSKSSAASAADFPPEISDSVANGLGVEAKPDFDSEYVFRGKKYSGENDQSKVAGSAVGRFTEKGTATFADGLAVGGMPKGSGGGSGGGVGSGFATDESRKIGREGFTGNYEPDKVEVSSGTHADYAGSVQSTVHDKAPVLGEESLTGKLFQSNGKVRKELAEGADESGGKDAAAEKYRDQSESNTRLANADMKWAIAKDFAKPVQKSSVMDERDFNGDELAGEVAAGDAMQVTDPLVERLKLQLDQAHQENRSPELISKLQETYDSVRTARRLDFNKRAAAKMKAPRVTAAPVIAQTETLTADNAWSTFSLNVSDVSFRLAAEAVRRGATPDSGSIRTEEFVNALTYRDPPPLPGEAVALHRDAARDPFAHDRTLLRLSLETAAEGRSAQSPMNLVVLLDTSGSMDRPDRRETVAAALAVLADGLRPGDTVSVVGFAREPRLVIDRMSGADTKALRELARTGVPAEGGTNLEGALTMAYAQLARQLPPGASGHVLLLTDGAANLGDADPARLAAVVADNRKQSRSLDCFGVGFDGYNDTMLETLSRKGGGRYAYMNDAGDAREEFGRKLAGALRPFASDVKVQVEFNPARVLAWRLLGYDNHRLRKQDFRDNAVAAAPLAAAEVGTALYSLEFKSDGEGDIGTVRVRYRIPDTQDYREREWSVPYEGAPAFDDAPESVRQAACAAFVAACFANSPDAAGIDRAALRKETVRLAVAHPGDPHLAALRDMANRLSESR